MNLERLGDDILDSKTGIKGGERILKNDLQVAAQPPQFAGIRREQVPACKHDRAGRGFDQAEDQASQRALAGAGFADQTEGLAGVNIERNVINCSHLAVRFPAECGFALRESFAEVTNFNQRHVPMLSHDRRFPEFVPRLGVGESS